jgi:TonB family protein
VRQHFAEPAEWRRAEIEVLVDADGNLLDIHVVSRSGRAELDAIALDAVRQAVASRPPRVGSGRTRARFLVEAGAVVTPPRPMTSMDAGGGQPGAVINLLTVKFDETNRKVRAIDHAVKKDVRTRVSLSYIAQEP